EHSAHGALHRAIARSLPEVLEGLSPLIGPATPTPIEAHRRAHSSYRPHRSPASGSRTRLSRLHPRHVVPKPTQAYELEVPVDVREWISPALASSDLVLEAQPPA